jgi:hypothetical protein
MQARLTHSSAMRTFWIADPSPPSRRPARLQWGSSEWAKDSCLAAWSEFEREWTGAPAPKSKRREASAPAPATTQAGSAGMPPFLMACFALIALGLGAFAWSVFRTLFG